MDRLSGKKIKLSIIVVNWNTPDMTLDCIRSVYEFAPSCSFEVLLVNNGSNGIPEESLLEFPGARIINTGVNLGFSKANNLGIYNSHGDYILLLNSDTKLTERSLDMMLDYMEKNENHSVGALAPRERDGQDRFRLSCGSFPTFFSEIERKIWHYRLSTDDYSFREYLDEKHSRMSNVDWVSGSCMMLRRSAVHDAGLLDENFFMYFEDIDLCNRFKKENWSIHYYPDTTIVHYGGGSARKNLMLVMTEYRRSEIYYARKYYGKGGEVLMRFFLFIKYVCYFLKSYPVFLLQKVLKRRYRENYVTDLLAKKVIEIAFYGFPTRPTEPRLGARKAGSAGSGN